MRERRQFRKQQDPSVFVHPLSEGAALWGHIPGRDNLRLPLNEGQNSGDLAIAFLESRDLRDVVRTVNEPSLDYSGDLTIVVNDCSPEFYEGFRNAVILMVLGMVPDKRRAADIALHYWYSALLPEEYNDEINDLVAASLASKKGVLDCKLSETSSVSGLVTDPHDVVTRIQTLKTQFKAEDVVKELQRVRFHPERVDDMDRVYWNLEPSHRVSILEFRRSGMVLPFGASKSHFDTPNYSLFSREGKWLQSDWASPLDAWDISSVVRAGQMHGASRADLFGCLYFYLSDQLYEFAKRLSRYKIAFKVFDMEPDVLLTSFTEGKLVQHGVPPSMRFDRIDIGHILGDEIPGNLLACAGWGRLLNDTEHAMLLGHLLNWLKEDPGEGAPGRLTEEIASATMNRLFIEGKMPATFQLACASGNSDDLMIAMAPP
ncbi:hypothetical protein BV25DRAFT_1278161 [Artomyces pyxidatus]|uniref:Uncharacterized protein n=1 Tax=Artomyces pyxidatus TaxID=48021 RepID=A0ACB8TFA1_9AGAM|nr:hypothetical protein BV25DRAFT_1278161 [Artomyces pyxidatus]